MHPAHVAELVAELEAIAAHARRAFIAVQSGQAVNGSTALRQIETRASDAARHARAADRAAA
jgi:hypothetical protein